MGLTASAQYYIPPDPFNDMLKESYGIWPNMGQVTDLQDSATPYIKFYTTGALPRAYFHKEGTFSLVVATPGDSLSGDTLRRLDITCAGEHAQYQDPVVWEMKDQYAHFCPRARRTVPPSYPYYRVMSRHLSPHRHAHLQRHGGAEDRLRHQSRGPPQGHRVEVHRPGPDGRGHLRQPEAAARG
ncbi:MAG: hypothetical protein IPI95_10940 [Flavobacteriales bacterium]|nr:hypothetical protein [Flavobacteriales bacterium]